MTNPLLEFDPARPVQKYSRQLPAGQNTFNLRNPVGDADAIVTLHDSDGNRVPVADVTVTDQTVRIEQAVGTVARVVFVG
jgi:hypothetical protein